jgi:putative Mn2+ efflux pump MntP
MIKESGEDSEGTCDFSFKAMLPLAVATSIDALAVGVTFAAMGCALSGLYTSNIFFNISIIGITTFLISIIGVKIGNVFGVRFKSKAELAGGVILILMGCKILLEHLGILAL